MKESDQSKAIFIALDEVAAMEESKGMTSDEFRDFMGELRMSQMDVARLLPIKDRTVRRWATHGAPGWAVNELRIKTGLARNPDLDKFVIGSGLGDNADPDKIYLIHTEYPRFICTVNKKVDYERGGSAFAAGNRIMQDFIWFDSMPGGSRVTQILDHACKLLDENNIATY